jgi:AraC-like DNA-binding protein
MSLLSEALRHKLIPWSQHRAEERFIVAQPKMNAAQMPGGVRLVRRKIAGPRETVKRSRDYGRARTMRAQWPQDRLFELDKYRMTCVLAGWLDFQMGSYSVECGEGFHLIFPPGTPLRDRVPYLRTEGPFCDTLNFLLHPHAVQCFFLHAQAGQPVTCRENYLFKNNSLVMTFQVLMDELTGKRSNRQSIGADLLSAFWAILQNDVAEQEYLNPGPIGRPRSAEENGAGFEAELLSYIQSHLNQPLALEGVARAMYLSRAQFVRRIRHETGKTFVQFLTDYRLAEAKVLLRDSEWSILLIAGFLGFKSSSYFQTVFRRATGQTPTQYRNSLRKKS